MDRRLLSSFRFSNYCRRSPEFPLLISRALDAQLLHATAESTRIQVEDFRRAALAFNHPVGLRQHRLDVTAFDFLNRADRDKGRRDGR